MGTPESKRRYFGDTYPRAAAVLAATLMGVLFGGGTWLVGPLSLEGGIALGLWIAVTGSVYLLLPGDDARQSSGGRLSVGWSRVLHGTQTIALMGALFLPTPELRIGTLVVSVVAGAILIVSASLDATAAAQSSTDAESFDT